MGKITRLCMVAAVSLLAAAPALADPPPWAPAHGYRAKQHSYVYYPGAQVYYAPESRLWFWFGGGQWRSGVSLPMGIRLGGMPGVSLVLDTGYPYERHGYVVEQYGRGDWDDHRHERRHRHEKHHKHHDRHDRHDH